MTETTCPCCGGVLAFVGIQESHPKSQRPALTLVECTTYGCELYLYTGTIKGLTETWQECEERRANQK